MNDKSILDMIDMSHEGTVYDNKGELIIHTAQMRNMFYLITC